MPGATVRIDGLRELNRSLKRVSTEYPKEQRSIHKKVAEPVARTAEVRAPRRSGNLAASIRPQGTQREGRVAAGKKAVPYAGPIHYGWPARNIKAQTFLTDALHTNQTIIVEIYMRETNRLIDRVWETIT